jgi:predicted DNA-binding transcriptional regulator YafY
LSTLQRQLEMLRLIRRYPQRTDTATLRARLKTLGYDVTLRTIQRDLLELAQSFQLDGDASKPQGWCWKKDAPALDIPGLDPQTALVFKMVEEHLKPLLPASTVNVLQPWFQAAKGVLGGTLLPLKKWPDKIRVLPKGMPLLPPKIDPAVQLTVYEALLEERWLRVSYRTGGGGESLSREVNPLALVQRGPLAYLVATVGSYTNPVMLLLHRMDFAEKLDRVGKTIDGFDLDQFIADGELNYRRGPPIKLVARFSKSVISAVSETPLSVDQYIEATDPQWFLVTATIPDTYELRAWLRGFGDQVVVLTPETLR